jgi:hypothetical protein
MFILKKIKNFIFNLFNKLNSAILFLVKGGLKKILLNFKSLIK